MLAEWLLVIASPEGLAIIVTSGAWLIESRSGQIPNLITLPMIPIGIVLGAGRGDLLWHATGFGVAMLGLIGFNRGVMGGGAAKLLLAVGALAGPVAPGLALVAILGLLQLKKTDEVPGSPMIAVATGAAILGRLLL